jgi:phenylalanyl-tRNA synthetase beta subunit
VELTCEYLKTFEFFDIYFDEKSVDKVTIGIRLIFQSNSKTLTNEIVEKESKKVRSFLLQKFNAEFKE